MWRCAQAALAGAASVLLARDLVDDRGLDAFELAGDVLADLVEITVARSALAVVGAEFVRAADRR